MEAPVFVDNVSNGRDRGPRRLALCAPLRRCRLKTQAEAPATVCIVRARAQVAHASTVGDGSSDGPSQRLLSWRRRFNDLFRASSRAPRAPPLPPRPALRNHGAPLGLARVRRRARAVRCRRARAAAREGRRVDHRPRHLLLGAAGRQAGAHAARARAGRARAPACAPAASVRAHDARCTAARAPARRPLGGARATLAHTSCTRALTPPWIKAAAA